MEIESHVNSALGLQLGNGSENFVAFLFACIFIFIAQICAQNFKIETVFCQLQRHEQSFALKIASSLRQG